MAEEGNVKERASTSDMDNPGVTIEDLQKQLQEIKGKLNDRAVGGIVNHHISSDSEDDSDFFRRVNVRNTETERPRPQIATAREEGEIDNGLNEILNEDENFLDELSNRFEDTGPRGPPVRSYFENFVQNRQNKKMNEAVLKTTEDRCLIPQNIELSVPKVNNAVWNNLHPKVKVIDTKIQKTQGLLNKITGNMLKGANDMLDWRNNETNQIRKTHYQEEIERKMDNVNLLLHANAELNYIRRENICNTFSKDSIYKRLASENIEVSKQFLFGDDLKGTLAEIEVASKIGSKLKGSYSIGYQHGQRHQYHPYSGYNSRM